MKIELNVNSCAKCPYAHWYDEQGLSGRFCFHSKAKPYTECPKNGIHKNCPLLETELKY